MQVVQVRTFTKVMDNVQIINKELREVIECRPGKEVTEVHSIMLGED
jgi:hypothetical protein